MIKGYISAKCPRCMSIVELARKVVRTTMFICPVCLEGEIEYRGERMNIDTTKSELPGKAIRPRRRAAVLVK